MSQHAQSRTGVAEVHGARLHYEVAGEGHPLVLLHAGIADRRMWDDQFDVFARHYRVIRYDLRGLGESEMPDGPYAHYQDLHGLLAVLGIERACLLGVSMGGSTALDFTLAYPASVDALILVGAGISGYTAYSAESIRTWEEVDAAIERGDIAGANELEVRMWVDGPARGPEQVSPFVRERVREMNGHNLMLATDQGTPRRLEPPATSRLAEICVPTLIVVGGGDVPDILTQADLLAEGIPRARKVVMPGLGHVPNMERPDEFNHLVLDFLEAVHSS